MKIIYLIGCSGSGKSTWAKNNFEEADIFSSDKTRFDLFKNPTYTKEEHQKVFDKLHNDIIEHCYKKGICVYDATNLHVKNRINFLDYVKSKGNIEVEAHLFFQDISILERNLLERAKNGGLEVSNEVLKRQLYTFNEPKIEEGYSKIIYHTPSKEEIDSIYNFYMKKEVAHKSFYHLENIETHIAWVTELSNTLFDYYDSEFDVSVVEDNSQNTLEYFKDVINRKLLNKGIYLSEIKNKELFKKALSIVGKFHDIGKYTSKIKGKTYNYQYMKHEIFSSLLLQNYFDDEDLKEIVLAVIKHHLKSHEGIELEKGLVSEKNYEIANLLSKVFEVIDDTCRIEIRLDVVSRQYKNKSGLHTLRKINPNIMGLFQVMHLPVKDTDFLIEILKKRNYVFDSKGNIVARSLSKIFNLSEIEENPLISKELLKKIQDAFMVDLSKTKAYEKYDGSMIQIFYNPITENFQVCSRGSLEENDYTHMANKVIKLKPEILKNLDKEWTYIFELVGRENKIVVDYKFKSDLIPTCKINNISGEIIELVDYIPYEEIDLEKSNFEGYVLFDGENMCKVKTNEYIELHDTFSQIENLNQLRISHKATLAFADIYLKNKFDDYYMVATSKFIKLYNAYQEFVDRVLDFQKYYETLSIEEIKKVHQTKHPLSGFTKYKIEDTDQYIRQTRKILTKLAEEIEKGE